MEEYRDPSFSHQRKPLSRNDATYCSPRSIGYDRGAAVVKHAFEKQQTLREAALELGVISAQEFDRHVKPETMVEPM
jgi:fumarate hydratase class II